MEQLLIGKNIYKSYGNDKKQLVLDNVSMEMKKGEFVAVMGASGSGKSTLLYALSGMDTIDTGEVQFARESLSQLSDNALSDLRRRKMGFVFQQPTLLKNLNMIDNIMLPQMRDNPKKSGQLAIKAKELMKQVGIDGLEQRSITEVSGGQLQRAGICRALMNQPDILFADEPTGALNSKSSDEIMMLFSEIHKKGTAILLVTHDAKVAAKAKRVLFMQDGKMVSEIVLTEISEDDIAQRTEMVLQETRRLAI